MPKIAEVTTSATTLEAIKGGAPEGALPSLFDMFLGLRGGAIGETCILALIIGFVYLVLRGVIYFETPLIYVGTVFVLSLIGYGSLEIALYQILSGAVVYAAVFMITDYVSTPITRTGKMIFAFGCGLITFLISLLFRSFFPNKQFRRSVTCPCYIFISFFNIRHNLSSKISR